MFPPRCKSSNYPQVCRPLPMAIRLPGEAAQVGYSGLVICSFKSQLWELADECSAALTCRVIGQFIQHLCLIQVLRRVNGLYRTFCSSGAAFTTPYWCKCTGIFTEVPQACLGGLKMARIILPEPSCRKEEAEGFMYQELGGNTNYTKTDSLSWEIFTCELCNHSLPL